MSHAHTGSFLLYPLPPWKYPCGEAKISGETRLTQVLSLSLVALAYTPQWVLMFYHTFTCTRALHALSPTKLCSKNHTSFFSSDKKLSLFFQ